MRFNNSRIGAFLSCPMFFKHRYLRKMVTKKRQNFFTFGTAIHRYIEIWYTTKDRKLALKNVEQIFNDVNRDGLNREEIHQLECDKNMALGIAAVYPDFYKGDFDEYTTFMTEQEFQFPLGDSGHSWFGTIDGLIKDGAGDWWILETKTAAAQTLNDGYFERVKIDNQITGYMYGAKNILGKFPKGIVYNVIKKPAIRLKKGESLAAFQKRIYQEYTKYGTEKHYFTREEIILSKHRLDGWLDMTTELVVELANKIKNKSKSLGVMNTGNCTAKYGVCTYMPACIANKYSPLLYEKNPDTK